MLGCSHLKHGTLNEDGYQMMKRMKLPYCCGKVPKENTFARLIGFHLDRYFEDVGDFITM